MRRILLTGAVAMAAVAGQANAQQIKIMTGPQGGSWYPLGGAIQSMLADDGISVQVLPGGGVANAQGVQGGQTDLAFGNSISVVDALEGRAPFEGKADNICLMATLYPQYFQMAAPKDSGIASVDDLKGKRITTQPVGNTAEQVMRAILQTAGMSYEDMRSVDYVSYSDGVGLVQDGNADMFSAGTTAPASAIMDLANSTEITMIPLTEDFIGKMRDNINPGYASLTIAAGTYPGQDADVTAVGYMTQLIGRCDLDDAVVTALMTNLWESRGDLATISAAMRDITLEKMMDPGGVPLHAAAKAFYEANAGK
ncbi:MAG: TAXI family TRAP transporter solute-binding subunit [Rhodobacterales bacterium]|jgi:TRAP transporter TAXI family solute receptor|nr:TAXI family TRAP transporter solute-binding subunit [Rhodobacterales bacterium]MDX5388847.1 TAXI family TRAP transporter solute-binding subunit [Rhodobacterales bacterium]MDX5488536.1 TAXI family TRAP transporter solute-binding subunit [Rhodobacterales bacterium]